MSSSFRLLHPVLRRLPAAQRLHFFAVAPQRVCSRLVQLQTFAVGPRKPFDDSHLLRSLNSEIERWTKAQAATRLCMQVLPEDLPKPFELINTPGTSDVIVRKTFNDEEISISCFLDADYPQSDEDEENSKREAKSNVPSLQQCLYMRVRITKGADKRSVEIVCCYVKDENDDILIEQVCYMADGKPQPGPLFQELQPDLQKAFVDVLKERGVTPMLGNFLIGYLINKYHNEYICWLQKLQSFVT